MKNFYNNILWFLSIISGILAFLMLLGIGGGFLEHFVLIIFFSFTSYWFNPIARIKINSFLKKIMFIKNDNNTILEKFAIGFLKFLFFILMCVFLGNTLSSIDTTQQSNNSSSPTPTNIDNYKTTKTTMSESDKIVLSQLECKEAIKAEAIDPNSIKINWRYYNGKLDSYISGKSVTLYGDVSGTNYYGGRVQKNFACETIVDEENDKIWVNDLNMD